MDRRSWTCAIPVAVAILLFAAPASAKVLKLRIDPATTEIVATVDAPLARIRGNVSGTFRVITGEIDGDPADPAATGHVDIVIDATSYQSDSARRDDAILRHVLETRSYQVIKFVSTRIKNLTWDAPNVIGSATIVGNLTLHGVTREIRVPISATLSTDGSFSADGDIQFDYTDFGIMPPHGLLGVLRAGKIVDLNFRVIAAPAGAPASTAPQH
jgi:polyisoprenoid-binding protein YceI